MIRRLLVANRGEAARRVLATCRLIGIETVAVYSDADADSPHVAAADWAVHLPGNAPTATYLRRDLLLAAARKTSADAIHPGWGMLATDPAFAAAADDAGLTWVGAPAKLLTALADRPSVVARLAAAGLPVPPSGGDSSRQLNGRSPAGRARCLEVEILVDPHGNTVSLVERECSIRRRDQALVVESPSPAVSPDLRERLLTTAARAAGAVGFTGAGTVEFLLTEDGEFHLRGLRPGLSPEHAVTECLVGLDLVRWELAVAEGSPLPTTDSPPARGHAVGVRLRAEDPGYAWLPTAGPLHRFWVPAPDGEFRPLTAPGLRVDAAVSAPTSINVYYDSALATLVACSATRYEAARLLAATLARSRIHGVVTNRDLLTRVLRHSAYLSGTVDTGFLEDHPEVFAPLLSSMDAVRLSCLAAALAAAAGRRAGTKVLGGLPSGWRNVPSGAQTTVYRGPAGLVEIGYRLGRQGELAHWWVRAVDPGELDLAGLGQPSSLPDDHPPVAIVAVDETTVVLDVAGVRITFTIHRVGDVSYVDSPEGSVVLAELPRYAEVVMLDDLPGA